MLIFSSSQSSCLLKGTLGMAKRIAVPASKVIVASVREKLGSMQVFHSPVSGVIILLAALGARPVLCCCYFPRNNSGV